MCQDGLDPISLRVEKLQMLRSPGVPADEKRFARIQRSGLIAHGQGAPSPKAHAVLWKADISSPPRGGPAVRGVDPLRLPISLDHGA